MTWRVLLMAAIVSFALQADERPATVTGRVIDATTGRPIAGVVVTPAGSALVPGQASSPPRALTNAAGEFVIRGLQKGTVHFTAGKAGYADATYKQRRPGGSGQGIPLEAGQRLANVEIRMWRHAAITGTVVDEAGEPAVGVRVRAFDQYFVAGRKRFSPGATAVTDDRGIYRIPNLLPGNYAIAVPSTITSVPDDVMDVFFGGSGGVPPDYRARAGRELNAIGSPIVPRGSPYAIGVAGHTLALAPGTLMPQVQPQGGLFVYPTVYFPAARMLSHASTVALRSGEERGSVDLQMHAERTSRVSGIVVGPNGPASLVAVRLVPAGSDDAVEPLDAATTVTNGGGDFVFAAVPPGQYALSVLMPPRDPIDLNEDQHVRASPGGGVSIGNAVVPVTPGTTTPAAVPADATLHARLPLTIGESDLSAVVVSLAIAPRVYGRVEFEGTADRPAPQAVARIRINLDPADGSRLPDLSMSAEAGHPSEDGAFRTVGVPPGRYVLRVNPPAGWFLKGAIYGGADLTDVPFDLSARDVSGVVITFTDRPSALTGTVRKDGNADPDAVVVAFPTDSAGWASRGAYPRRMRTARARRDGTYTMEALAAGEYYVAAIHEDEYPDWQDPALLAGLARIARTVRVLEGERRTEDLTPVIIR